VTPRGRLAIALVAGCAVAAVTAWNVTAQSSGGDAGAPVATQPSDSPTPPGVPILQAPPEAPVVAPPASNSAAPDDSDETSQAGAKITTAPPPPPTAPPVLPVRSPAAILQVLDKVTTETMRFAAPVGQRVRYKNLVFTVKACETSGLGQASPEASAYLVVDSQPAPVAGRPPVEAKQVFRGWMFANSPGLNPLQHPIYDAWLIACMAAAPPA
jgi:hypothetical protein